MIAYYLTHPQVEIDRNVPVPRWGLSALGRARARSLTGRRWLGELRRIVSSEECKARETADILAGFLGLDVETRPELGENDRSATGFLEPEAFEAAADRFFAEPETSWNGWERAVDAADRVSNAVAEVLGTHDARVPILFVGHGAVGTLLKCRVAGRAISRQEDQPAGGGNVFAYRIADRKLIRDWTPMEAFEGGAHDA